MSETIGTERLQLVIGVPKSVGDTLSAEQGVRVFPLVLTNFTGFGVNPANPWQPGRPALKDQWNESRLADGRSLAGVAVGNVIETIELKAAAGDRLTLESRINELSRFINQARAFFATFYQIEPVYLEWAAKGGKGSQYALVYTIDMSVAYNYPGTGADARATVTLVIEREPAWRGVPPGASAKLWTQYVRGNLPGASFDYSDLDWRSGDALVTATIQNRNEYSEATDNYDYPSLSSNWIDIDAEDIPGDAPALVALVIDAGEEDAQVDDRYISRITEPLTVTARPSSRRGRPLSLNMADAEQLAGGVSTPTKVTDTTSGNRNSSSGTRQVVNVTADDSDIRFGYDLSGNTTTRRLDFNSLRGKHNLFLRLYTGTAVDVTGSITFEDNHFNRVVYAFRFSTSASAGVIQTFFLTAFTLPTANRAVMDPNGAGLYIRSNAQTATDYISRIELEITTISDAATLSLIDLFWVPYDEPAVKISGLCNKKVLYDTTGYISRGLSGGQVMSLTDGVIEDSVVVVTDFELSGQDIVLVPGVDNRLAIWQVDDVTASLDNTNNNRESTVTVDIVPRWFGVRDA